MRIPPAPQNDSEHIAVSRRIDIRNSLPEEPLRMAKTLKGSSQQFYLSFIIFILIWGTLFKFASNEYLTNEQAEIDAKSLQKASQLRALVETEINKAAFLATGVESYIIARKGFVDDEEMSVILGLIYERGPYFRNIGIAPKNVISMVFPLSGNEAAIGLHYDKNPKQWPAIEKIIQLKQGFLAGPLTLIQGGSGFIFRTPIYIENEYWGLLSTVIDADKFLSLLSDEASSPASTVLLQISLKGRDAQGAKGGVFFGDEQLFEADAKVLRVSVPGGEWLMAYRATETLTAKSEKIYVFLVLAALLLAYLSAFLVRTWLNRGLLHTLRREVDERTKELRQTNFLLESVLSSARSFAIIVTDKLGVIDLFNSGAESMLGYRAEEMTNRANLSILLNDSAGCEGFFGSLGVEEEYKIQEFDYVQKNGQLVSVQVVLSRIKNENQQFAGYLIIAEDITERKRIERMKDEFVSTVSHELRTPLTAISGALGLIKGGVAGELPTTLKRMLDVAFKNSQRLGMLINDLLDMEKLMAGKMMFELKEYNLHDLLEHMIESNQSYADQYGVELVLLECDPELKIMVDVDRFAQVMSNLLSNAAKFSPKDGRVEINVTEKEKQVRLSVRDYGEGIPESFRSRIFQKFSQADSSDKRQKGGSGLGLAITKELVERMQGEIDFKTNSTGTEFFVCFKKMLAEPN